MPLSSPATALQSLSALPHARRLALRFDPLAMQRDLAALGRRDWTAHYVPQNYTGDWSVLPLRCPQGASHPILRISANPGDVWEDTEYMDALPGVRAALQSFEAPLGAARLMRLGAGATIREHCDPDLDPEGGTVRLHIPILSNDDVDFRVGGNRIAMLPGECWFLRLTFPHSVANRGATDRIHLVVDLTVNAWLETQLWPRRDGMSQRQPAEPASPPVGIVKGQWLEPGGGEAAARIQHFLSGIGIVVRNGALPPNTLLPNLDVVAGEIVVDPERSGWPGDLLHEAGHIAVMDPAQRGRASVEPDPAEEMAAIAWSVAAAAACGIPLATLFHPEGYKGASQSLIDAFETGPGFGTPMLQYWGMCSPAAAGDSRQRLPNLSRWLR